MVALAVPWSRVEREAVTPADLRIVKTMIWIAYLIGALSGFGVAWAVWS